jgi:glutamate--cysteine ligase
MIEAEGWLIRNDDKVFLGAAFKPEKKNGAGITFEPGGQIEYSSEPFPTLQEAYKKLYDFQILLKNKGADAHIEFFHWGCHPWHTVKDLALRIPKPRYRAMKRYFDRDSIYGAQMMHLSATIQICLDLGETEEICVKRLKCADLIAPIGAAIFANSPFAFSKMTKVKSYRRQIWHRMDPSRTGFYLSLEEKNLKDCALSYLDFALKAPVIFIPNFEDAPLLPKDFSFHTWLSNGHNGIYPSLEEFKIHLSLLFPEVRPKGYLELRSIDAQNPVWQETVGAFYWGLLYNEKNITELIEQKNSLFFYSNPKEIVELSEQGLDHPEIAQLADILFIRSMEGLRQEGLFREEKILSVFYEHFIRRKKTPADDILFAIGKSKSQIPSLSSYRHLEDSWRRLLL